jgi:hypothetical protein
LTESEDWKESPEELEEEEEEAMAEERVFWLMEGDEDANCSVGFK